MQVGDIVGIQIDEDVLVIGDVIEDPETMKLVVWEAHAFHPLWGGSSLKRGTVHSLDGAQVVDCPGAYKHIVRDQAAKRKEVNGRG